MADAVKPVAADALVQPFVGSAVDVGLGRKRGMKIGFKYRDLRHTATNDPFHRFDNAPLDGIMRRSEDCEPVDLLRHFGSDESALPQFFAAVYDAMANRFNPAPILNNAGLTAPHRFDSRHELLTQPVDGRLAVQECSRFGANPYSGGAIPTRPVRLEIPQGLHRITGDRSRQSVQAAFEATRADVENKYIHKARLPTALLYETVADTSAS